MDINTVNGNCPCNKDSSRSSGTMNIPYKYHDNQVVAMAYVPWQRWDKTYEPCKALAIGTIFPDLNKPFEGGCCR